MWIISNEDYINTGGECPDKVITILNEMYINTGGECPDKVIIKSV